MTTMIQRLALAAAATLCMAGAQAATVYSNNFNGLGALTSPDTISTSFAASAGAATLDFQLAGYASLDGDNWYVDIFHLVVNGAEVFSSTFNLGGGGADRVLLAPVGATATRVGGQLFDISLPVSLVAGTNSIQFSYESPLSFEGSGRAGFQGLGDEGWGVNQMMVSAPVPEPRTWVLALAGLGALALTSRRRMAAAAKR